MLKVLLYKLYRPHSEMAAGLLWWSLMLTWFLLPMFSWDSGKLVDSVHRMRKGTSSWEPPCLRPRSQPQAVASTIAAHSQRSLRTASTQALNMSTCTDALNRLAISLEQENDPAKCSQISAGRENSHLGNNAGTGAMFTILKLSSWAKWTKRRL